MKSFQIQSILMAKTLLRLEYWENYKNLVASTTGENCVKTQCRIVYSGGWQYDVEHGVYLVTSTYLKMWELTVDKPILIGFVF